MDAAWSEEKVVKVPLAMPLQMASVSSEVSRSGGEQTALAPVAVLIDVVNMFLSYLGTVKVIALQTFC